MADLVLKSERQVQTQILAFLIDELGLNDINPGSVLDVLTQSIAQQDFALYYQIGLVSRLNTLDALSGDDLDLKAFEFGISLSVKPGIFFCISSAIPDLRRLPVWRSTQYTDISAN